MPSPIQSCAFLLAFVCGVAGTSPGRAQQSVSSAASPEEQQNFRFEQERLHLATAADFEDMLAQLHLRREAMRPGADGNGKGPHPVNYDENKVPLYTFPDPLLMANRKPVRTPADWWGKRRPELVHQLEDSMYGRVPAHTPGVAWSVVSSSNGEVGGIDATTTKLRGHVDNTADPAISVDIDVELTLPVHPASRIPVIIAFDWPPEFWADMARRTGHAMPPPKGPTAREEVLSRGWGYAMLVPTSVQADNGAGLTSGIIGLCNGGARRTPTQWGALRAWAWGASRLLDYLGTQSVVDTHRVGIFGHSRYGKAALVTMAFDHRFAIGYISSSGEGGAKPSRRYYGETLENAAGESEYHWFAGNFLRYAGPQTANDLPIDAHDLIALCAPRALFLGGGTQAAGDGWADARGSFIAAVASSPVYKLLGVQGLGTSTFPPVLTEVGNGPLAFRQHEEGHTPAPNWPPFLAFMQRELYGADFATNLNAQ